MIGPYLHVAKRGLLDTLVYRADLLTGLLLGVVYLFVRAAVWSGLYAGKGLVAGTSLSEAITYTILSGLVARVIGIRISAEIEDKIHTGNLAYDLLRPVSPRTRLFFEAFGKMAGDIATRSLPAAVVGALLFGLLPPASSWHLAAFVVTLALGMLIVLMIELVFTSLGFWLVQTRPVSNFYNAAAALLSGSVVPLWFFPSWLRPVADVLPFKLSAFVPIAFYLGKIPVGDLGGTVLRQAGWIVGLWALQQFLWSRGIRRAVIQGG